MGKDYEALSKYAATKERIVDLREELVETQEELDRLGKKIKDLLTKHGAVMVGDAVFYLDQDRNVVSMPCVSGYKLDR